MDLARRFSLALLLLACLFLLPQAAQSQTTLTASVGLGLASLGGDDVDEDFESTDGFLFGAHLGFPLGSVISLAPGLYWVQKGGKIEEGTTSFSIELDYLEVPLLVSFRVTGANRPVGVSLFLGPSLAFETSCHVKLKFDEDEASADCDEEEQSGFDERRALDLGAAFGAGVAFPIRESLSLIVNAGLDLGLRSLDASTNQSDVKNSMWFLAASVGFPLGG